MRRQLSLVQPRGLNYVFLNVHFLLHELLEGWMLNQILVVSKAADVGCDELPLFRRQCLPSQRLQHFLRRLWDEEPGELQCKDNMQLLEGLRLLLHLLIHDLRELLVHIAQQTGLIEVNGADHLAALLGVIG